MGDINYLLKNGETLNLAEPSVEDAEALIFIISTADRESKFLARNPGEFTFTPQQERALILGRRESEGSGWYIAKIGGEAVGMCSVAFVRGEQRFRHRAQCAFVVLKKHWGKGIGGKMMESVLKWCRDMGVEQLELDCVAENTTALNMYHGFGFKEWGRVIHGMKYPDGTYTDLIEMRLVL